MLHDFGVKMYSVKSIIAKMHALLSTFHFTSNFRIIH